MFRTLCFFRASEQKIPCIQHTKKNVACTKNCIPGYHIAKITSKPIKEVPKPLPATRFSIFLNSLFRFKFLQYICALVLVNSVNVRCASDSQGLVLPYFSIGKTGAKRNPRQMPGGHFEREGAIVTPRSCGTQK